MFRRRLFNQANDFTKTDKKYFTDDVKERCKEDFFNDATIVIDYTTFFANKKILSSYSGYFKNLFEKNPNKSLIRLEDVDKDTMGTILFYFYTKRIILDDYNIEKILAASKILQIDELEFMCLEKLGFPFLYEYEDELEEEIHIQYAKLQTQIDFCTIFFVLIVMLLSL